MATYIALSCTFFTAVLGTVLDTSNVQTKYLLITFATLSFLVSTFLAHQNKKDTQFLKKALGHLIQGTKPSQLSINYVIDIIVKEFDRRGLSNVSVRVSENTVRCSVLAAKNSYIVGIVCFSMQDISSLVVKDEKNLKNSIIDKFFLEGHQEKIPVDECWNFLYDAISSMIHQLYFEFYADTPVKLHLDSSNYSITVREKQVSTRQHGKKILPEIVFSKGQLSYLIGTSYFEASRIIIGWMQPHWGSPHK